MKNNKHEILNDFCRASSIQPKHINFDAQEALQICTYKQIGEVMNKSFIEASSKFKSSLGTVRFFNRISISLNNTVNVIFIEMTSSIRKDLVKLHIQR